MARTRRTIQPPHVLPGHSLRQTPWANPHIWDAADLPAQWPPESSPVHDIDQVRTTPWGLQGRYHCEHKPGDHEYIWLPSFFRDLGPAWNPGLRMERTIRGRWVRDHIVRKNTGSMSAYRPPLRRPGAPPEPLSLPQDHVMQAYPLEHEDVVCTADLDMADVPDATIKPYPGGRGMLDKLPVELLRMIIEYLVPTGCTYSFFMADRRNNYPEPRSFCSVVHQMVPVWRSKKRDDQDIKEQVADGMDQMASDLENDYDPYFSDNETYEEMSQEDNKLRKETIQKGSAHMALASVNRTFQDLVYTRFYGGNTFVFHLSTYPFTRIDLETGDLQDRLWLSWSRVLIRNVWPPGPLGPITARAARYFGDAKLIIVAPSEDTSDAEAMTYLAQVVDSAISLLLPTDPISEEQEKQQQPNISLHLQFSSPSPFHVKKKIVTLQAGVNRVTRPMDIGPGTWSGFGGQSLEQPPVENKLDLVIQPLRKLRGLVKDMCVYGYEISLDFLDEVGLVCVDKAKRTPTPAEHYHSRASTKTNAESGVPTPQYQLEAMGWTFFKAMERSKRSDRSGTTPSPTPTTKSTGTNRVIRIPSQYGIGPWSP